MKFMVFLMVRFFEVFSLHKHPTAAGPLGVSIPRSSPPKRSCGPEKEPWIFETKTGKKTRKTKKTQGNPRKTRFFYGFLPYLKEKLMVFPWVFLRCFLDPEIIGIILVFLGFFLFSTTPMTETQIILLSLLHVTYSLT